jgi:molybdopterin converting factor small subunit
MKVTVHYAAQIRQAASCASELIELDGPCSVAELVRLLAQRHGPPLCDLLLDRQGQTQPALLLFVGEEQVELGSAWMLRDGDEVTVLAPMAGG